MSQILGLSSFSNISVEGESEFWWFEEPGHPVMANRVSLKEENTR
jgi:hypothetical protein